MCRDIVGGAGAAECGQPSDARRCRKQVDGAGRRRRNRPSFSHGIARDRAKPSSAAHGDESAAESHEARTCGLFEDCRSATGQTGGPSARRVGILPIGHPKKPRAGTQPRHTRHCVPTRPAPSGDEWNIATGYQSPTLNGCRARRPQTPRCRRRMGARNRRGCAMQTWRAASTSTASSVTADSEAARRDCQLTGFA